MNRIQLFLFSVAAFSAALLCGCQREDVIEPIVPFCLDTFAIPGDTVGFHSTEGRLPGRFAIGNEGADTHYVCFSQGNLQWSAAGTHAVAAAELEAGTWRFALHQYDVVGSPSQYASSASSYFLYPGNVEDGDNALISATFRGWIDLFGWGTSGYHGTYDSYNTNYHPYSTSSATVNTTYNYYGYGPSTNLTSRNLTGASARYDWGVYNAISNGGNKPMKWRTLAYDEWYYLRNNRSHAAEKYAVCSILIAPGNSVSGCVLLPDDWVLPDGCAFVPGISTFQTYTLDQWALMEAAGAVFLPAAGGRSVDNVHSVGYYGYYWLSNYASSSHSYMVSLGSNGLSISEGNRNGGRSVRLVQDVE